VNQPLPVEVRDDSIRLGQFLKLAGAVDQGSEVKELLASGLVAVNGDTETRRGRQLRAGDRVAVGRTTYAVAPRTR
jgi:ribosome-associated protein